MRRTVLAVMVAGSIAVAMPDGAEASEPQSSRYVDAASVVLEPSHLIEDRTVFTGIQECETLADSDRSVDVSFETNVDISDSNLFGGVYHYELERGGNPISCADGDGEVHEECTQVDSDDLTFVGEEAGASTQLDVSLDFDTLTELTAQDCEAGEIDNSYYIQLRVRDYSTGGDFLEWERSEIRVIVDLIRPESPVLTDAMATENSIVVEFEPSESADVDNHAVVYSTEPFDQGERADEVMGRAPVGIPGENVDSGEVGVELEGDATIYVGVVARDQAGNYSVVSEPMETAVMETEGFWDYYVTAGGDEEGGYGCSSTTTLSPTAVVGWAAVVAMALLLWRGFARRRNQKMSTVEVRNQEVRRR